MSSTDTTTSNSLNNSLIGKKKDRIDLLDADDQSLIGDTPHTGEALHMARPTDDDLRKQALKKERERARGQQDTSSEGRNVQDDDANERKQSTQQKLSVEQRYMYRACHDPIVQKLKAEREANAGRTKQIYLPPSTIDVDNFHIQQLRPSTMEDDSRRHNSTTGSHLKVTVNVEKRRPEMDDVSSRQPATTTRPMRGTAADVDNLPIQRRSDMQDDSSTRQTAQSTTSGTTVDVDDIASCCKCRPEMEDGSSWQPTAAPSSRMTAKEKVESSSQTAAAPSPGMTAKEELEEELVSGRKSGPDDDEQSTWQPTSMESQSKLGRKKGLLVPGGHSQDQNLPNNAGGGCLPGAYAGGPGQNPLTPPLYSQVMGRIRNQTTPTTNLSLMEEGVEDKPTEITSSSEQIIGTVPEHDDDGDEEKGSGGLVVAVPATRTSQLQEAMQMDAKAVQQQQQIKKKKGKKTLICGGVAFLLLIVVVVVTSLVAKKSLDRSENPASTKAASMSPSLSPSVILPPMDNLEILYEELADNTKNSLLDATSHQRKAWDWLLHHHNITNLPEWRKQQLFALVTFFHAFEGPQWPEEIRKDWLNETVDECLWINTSLRYLYGISATYLRSLAFDFNPCNAEGEFQTIALIYLKLARANPVMPPEILLLPSLSHLILALSEIKAPLSDMLPSEIYQLRNLDMFVLHGNSISGSIPRQFGMLTAPRYILFGTNEISGTVPTELGLLTSNLSDLDLHENNLVGTIPSELGLLTMATSLDLHGNQLVGSIPSECGRMTNLQELQFDGNSLTGSIPSELGLLTLTKRLHLQNTNLSGSIPLELWNLTPALKDLSLTNLPLLSGSIPDDLCYLQQQQANNDTSCFVFEGHGSLPGSYECSLQFSCSDILCGCGCSCSSQNSTSFLFFGNHT